MGEVGLGLAARRQGAGRKGTTRVLLASGAWGSGMLLDALPRAGPPTAGTDPAAEGPAELGPVAQAAVSRVSVPHCSHLEAKEELTPTEVLREQASSYTQGTEHQRDLWQLRGFVCK